MGAELLAREKTSVSDTAFFEIVVWRLPSPVPGCTHVYKYRCALVVNNVCVLRYDNERGKGDHRHIGDREEPFAFSSVAALLDAFHADMERMLE